jgi:hypothetical protein
MTKITDSSVFTQIQGEQAQDSDVLMLGRIGENPTLPLGELPAYFGASPTAITVAILGHEQFNQSTRPTVRRDGSALVAGDRWYDTTDALWWRWDGTYWKQESILSCSLSNAFNTSINVSPGLLAVDQGYDLWPESLRIAKLYGSNHDELNHFTIQCRYRTNDSTYVFFGAEDNTILACGATPETPVNIPLGLHLDVDALDISSIQCLISPQGSPPASGYVVSFDYRLVKR